MQNNEKPIVLSVVLLVISVVVALLLSFTNLITEEKIAQNNQDEQNRAKQEVLSAYKFVDLSYTDGIVKGVFEGKDGSGNTLGWCVNVTPNGYGGQIDLMVGIDKDKTLLGIKVVSNSETAGLGAKCTNDDFAGQFHGKEMPISVIKSGTPKDNEIVAITGATITSRAVVQGVNKAYEVVDSIGGGTNE